jgi:uncharacterized protein YdeI (BOF family)
MTPRDILDNSIYADKEERIFREPIGPVWTDTARPLIESRIVEHARISYYNPAEAAADRLKLFNLVEIQYADGQIKLPFDPHEMTLDEAINAYLDERIVVKKAAFEEIGGDRELFQDQLGAIKFMAKQLKAHREAERELRAEASTHQVGKLKLRLALLDHLSPEGLVILEDHIGITDIVHEAPTTDSQPETQPTFETLIETTHDMLEGALDDVRAKEPPHTAEVLVANERSVA